ncbi:uncharacterized protein LOC126661599 [Mercurialis annua]|uniref:uncharacterized protein LOC126661599 n=1 Tax=Mercurialis annua TaxID=3986 RepID=UPI00215E83FE|nr:uncharacterized protein LOC126661599 [Mercurialis annua]
MSMDDLAVSLKGLKDELTVSLKALRDELAVSLKALEDDVTVSLRSLKEDMDSAVKNLKEDLAFSLSLKEKEKVLALGQMELSLKEITGLHDLETKKTEMLNSLEIKNTEMLHLLKIREIAVDSKEKELMRRELKCQPQQGDDDKAMITSLGSRISALKNEELAATKQGNDVILLPMQMPLYGILIAFMTLIFPYEDNTNVSFIIGVTMLLFFGFFLGMIPPFIVSYQTLRKLGEVVVGLSARNRKLFQEVENFDGPSSGPTEPTGAVSSGQVADLPLQRTASVLNVLHSLKCQSEAISESLGGFSCHYNRMLYVQFGSALAFSLAIPLTTGLLYSKMLTYHRS